MEYLVLNSYLKFKKQRKKKWKDIVKQNGWWGIVCFALVILGFVVAIVGILKWEIIYICVAYIPEAASLLFLIKYTDSRDVQESKLRLEKSEQDYQDTLEWVKQIGYGEKLQIKQLCARCEVIVQSTEKKKKESEELVDKVLTIIIIPFILILITAIVNLKNSYYIEMSICLILLCVLVYILAILVNRWINRFTYSDEEEMKQMLSHLHGVLDRCFSLTEEDIV